MTDGVIADRLGTLRIGSAPPRWVAVVGTEDPPQVLSGTRWAGTHAGDGGTLRYLSERGVPELSVAASDVGLAAVLEGRLHGLADLARRFDLRPPEDASGAADLVLRLYRRLGDRVVEELQGYFSLVLYDAPARTVVAARDASAVQPLYWARSDAGLAFSTSMEVLTALPGVSGEPDPEIVGAYLLNRWPRRDETFLRGVRRVPVANVARFENGEPETRRFWIPDPPERHSDWIRDDAVDRFSEVFLRSVSHAVELGRAGIYLSGGLDSVTVAAFTLEASENLDRPPPLGLSLIFPRPYSEEEIQRGVGHELGIEHHAPDFYSAAGGEGRVLHAALKWSAALPSPLQNFWMPAYASMAAHAVDRDCRVILTGGGGDEWLTVDPFYGADLLARLRIVALWRHFRLYQRSHNVPTLPLARSILWDSGARPILVSALAGGLGLVPGGRRALDRFSLRRWVRNMPDWALPDPTLRRAVLDRVLETMEDRRWPAPGRHYLQVLRNDPHPLLSLGTEENFVVGRRLGIRVLEPFWDREVVDFLARVHPEVLNAGGWSKALVRNSLERRFPGLGFRRQQKLLAGSLFMKIIADEGPDRYGGSGRLPTLAGMGVLDPRGFDDLVERVKGSSSIQEPNTLWHALNLEAWSAPRVG